MAALTSANPQVVAGPIMETVSMLIENGESWKAGQFLYVDTSGLLNACTSDITAIKYYALQDQDDPGNSTTFAEVVIIHADHVFEGNELDGTVTAANIGQFFGIDVTSNVVTVDVAEVTALVLEIVDLGYLRNPAVYTSADILAKVYFKILSIALERAPA